MNDRLGELTGGRSGSSGGGVAPFEVAIDINDTGDGGLGAGAGGGQARGFMEGFFDKVNEVKKDIDAIKKVCVSLCTAAAALVVPSCCSRWLVLLLTTLGHAWSIRVQETAVKRVLKSRWNAAILVGVVERMDPTKSCSWYSSQYNLKARASCLVIHPFGNYACFLLPPIPPCTKR